MSCKNCERREPRCHSHCEEYIAFRAKRDEINQLMHKAHESDFARAKWISDSRKRFKEGK